MLMPNSPMAFLLRSIIDLLLCLVCEEIAERVEALVPELFVARCPFGYCTQRCCAQLQIVFAADAPAMHEARAFQQFDVLGNGVERHRERLREIAYTRITAGQTRDDAAAGWVGEGGEGKIKRSHGHLYIQPIG